MMLCEEINLAVVDLNCDDIELGAVDLSCDYSLFKEYPWGESAIANGGDFSPWEEGTETLGGISNPWGIVPTVNGGDTGEFEPSLNVVVTYR